MFAPAGEDIEIFKKIPLNEIHAKIEYKEIEYGMVHFVFFFNGRISGRLDSKETLASS